MLAPYFQEKWTEAGIDEAGRGAYAGPVYAAAVVLPKDFYHPLLNDSKQLKEKERDQLKAFIEKEAIAFAVGVVDQEEIDRINILKATYKAMHLAVSGLCTRPEFLLVDGNRFSPYPLIRHRCIVKGDSLYASIAAASILAKTGRDAFMKKIHSEFPQYGWDKNKGYGTPIHRKAIELNGLCTYHRKSYNILPGDSFLFKK